VVGNALVDTEMDVFISPILKDYFDGYRCASFVSNPQILLSWLWGILLSGMLLF
jgi:hypothetical protein